MTGDPLGMQADLNRLLALVRHVLTANQRDDMQAFIVAGEWGLAVQTLCEVLYEDKLPLAPKAYTLIERVGRHIGLAPRYWEVLQPQVVQ